MDDDLHLAFQATDFDRLDLHWLALFARRDFDRNFVKVDDFASSRIGLARGRDHPNDHRKNQREESEDQRE